MSEGMGQCRLADARHVFDQQMPASKEAGHTKPNLLRLAQDDAFQRLERAAEGCCVGG